MKLSKTMYNILIAVSALVFVVSACFVVSYFVESYQQAKEFEELASLVGTTPDQPTPSNPDETSGEGNSNTPSVDSTPSKVTYEEVVNPNTGETFQVLSQYAKLYEMNSDIVGWLRIPDSSISYPVMHTPAEPEYYLRRSFYKEDSRHGCLFVQGEADVFYPSDNITIYGHHMRDGSMFADLMNYQEMSYWEDHKRIYFDTITNMYAYEVMSVFITTASLGKGFPYHEFVNAVDEKDFDDFVDTCHSLELYDTGVDAEYGDKLITLSTCEYTQINGRLVVVARRVE